MGLAQMPDQASWSEILPASVSLETLNDYANELVSFLQPWAFLWRSHIVDTFKDRVWEGVPPAWSLALQDTPLENLLQVPSGFVDPTWPCDFRRFIVRARALCLSRKRQANMGILGSDEGADSLSGSSETDEFEKCMPKVLLNGMDRKKRHEVTLLSAFAAAVAEQAEADAIVDVGAGQGYLSQVLAFKFGFRVFAVDSSDHHGRVTSARSKKTAHFWNHPKREKDEEFQRQQLQGRRGRRSGEEGSGEAKRHEGPIALTFRMNLQNCCDYISSLVSTNEGEGMRGKSEVRVTYEDCQSESRAGTEARETAGRLAASPMETRFSKDESDASFSDRVTRPQVQESIADSVVRKEGQEGARLALVALHACGDLSVCLLKALKERNEVAAVVVVSCCYHLLTERSEHGHERGRENQAANSPQEMEESDLNPADSGEHAVPVPSDEKLPVESSWEANGACRSSPQEGKELAGFPLSSTVKGLGFKLGRNARDTACQCTDRWSAAEAAAAEELFESHAFRAGFQVVLQRYFPETAATKVCVGRLKKTAKRRQRAARMQQQRGQGGVEQRDNNEETASQPTLDQFSSAGASQAASDARKLKPAAEAAEAAKAANGETGPGENEPFAAVSLSDRKEVVHERGAGGEGLERQCGTSSSLSSRAKVRTKQSHERAPSFLDYVSRSLGLLGLQQLDGWQVEEVWDEISPHLGHVRALWALRVLFAPLIESLIILDRLLYIREETDDWAGGQRQPKIDFGVVALFDPKISPRNVAIVAVKKQSN